MSRGPDKITAMIRKEVRKDANSPYTVLVKSDEEDSRGNATWETKMINALSQPTSDKDRSRLQEGDRFKVSRFWAMCDDNTVDVGNKVVYKGNKYEIKFLQDWDISMKAIGVLVG